MNILTQLNRAMAYIEAHIDDDLALDDAAGVTAYSPYHFGRLFYYIADMSLAEYIRKRKMSLAAIKLQSGNEKVLDLALRYGYDSADSFTRAFVKQHGVTPSQARQPGVNLTIFPPLMFQIKITGVKAMNWRIEEREAFEMFGAERVFRNDETDLCPAFWTEFHASGGYERLAAAAGAYRNSPGECAIGAVCGYGDSSEETWRYMIGARLERACDTTGFVTAQIPKTTWAVFRSEEVENIGLEIPKLFNRAYSEWLPTSGYEKVNGPDLEIYGEGSSGKYWEEVWIPVRKL
jgi:AraC family transcriptional regulator